MIRNVKTKAFLFVFPAIFLGCAHGRVRGDESGMPTRHNGGESPLASMAKSDTAVPEPTDVTAVSEPVAPRDVSGLFRKSGTKPESGSTEDDLPKLGRQSELSPWRSLFAAMLVLGLLVAVNIVLRRRVRGAFPGRKEDDDMSLIGSLSLDHRRRLLLVAVGNRRALLCSGRDGVVSIATFDPPDEPPADSPATSA